MKDNQSRSMTHNNLAPTAIFIWIMKSSNWHINHDIICCLEERGENMITKRRILLSIAATFYDPLGLISTISLRWEIMFQQLCKSIVDWGNHWQILRIMEQDNPEIERSKLGRYSREESTDLRLFGDASESSYGACVVRYDTRKVRLIAIQLL